MKPVSFVRTSPQALGENSDLEGYHNPLSLDAHFVQHPTSTFFVCVGPEVPEAPELEVRVGDMLVVDRSATPTPQDVVLVACDGELLLMHHQDGRPAVCELWGRVVALARKV